MEASLLCENCGYGIQGLEAEARCPECGQPLAPSLEPHAGSPWQNSPGLGTWLRTFGRLLTGPMATMKSLRVDRRGARPLVAVNAVVAGLMLVAPWVGVVIGDPARSSGGSSPWTVTPGYVVGLAGEGLIAAVVFLVVMGMPGWIYLRTAGSTRGNRLYPEARLQVLAHASYLWVVMALLPMLALAVYFVLSNYASVGASGTVQVRGRATSMTVLVPGGVLLATLGAGAWMYAALLIRGLAAGRFANRHAAPAVVSTAA